MDEQNSTREKTCPSCKQSKLFVEFNLDKTKKHGISSRCKACCRDASLRRYAANSERLAAEKRAYRSANLEKVRLYEAARYAADPSKKIAGSKKWKAANLEKDKASKALYRAENSEKIKLAKKNYVAQNPEKIKGAHAKWRDKNKAVVRAYSARWKANNPEKVKADSAAYYAANTAELNAKSAYWYVKNSAKRCAVAAAWRAANVEATRLYKQNRREKQRGNGGKLSRGLVEKLFALQKGKCPCCKRPLGEGYHLDHKMPVSLGGAHEDSNMQLLTATCNMQKNAKHPVDFMQSRGFLL